MSREKKRMPDFDHTYCAQGSKISTSQDSITENGNRLINMQFVLIQSYRPLQTFSRTHLAAWIQISS